MERANALCRAGKKSAIREYATGLQEAWREGREAVREGEEEERKEEKEGRRKSEIYSMYKVLPHHYCGIN